jgi:hypothetical protein
MGDLVEDEALVGEARRGGQGHGEREVLLEVGAQALGHVGEEAVGVFAQLAILELHALAGEVHQQLGHGLRKR